MRITRILLLLLLTGTIASCEKVLEIDIREQQPVLVIEGWLTSKRESHTVKVYYTSPVIAGAAPSVVSNALITLKDNAGNSETLKEMEKGVYEISRIRGREGRTYTLSVAFEGNAYEASSVMPRLSMEPDTLEFKYKTKQLLFPDEGYYPFISGQELEGIGDFTQYKIFRNGKFLNKATEINLFRDKYVDGNRIGNYQLEIDSPFLSGDHIQVEAWSLTEANYNILADIREQLNNSGLFASPLPNARSNIRKVNPSSENVTGFFGASIVRSVERYVP
jgi:hypothetical protein